MRYFQYMQNFCNNESNSWRICSPSQFTVILWKFYSPQVKPDLISSIINFVYELPHELPSDLALSWKLD